MNIVKLRNIVKEGEFAIESILTDSIIRFDNKGNCVIVVYKTEKVRVLPISDIKYICDIADFTGE